SGPYNPSRPMPSCRSWPGCSPCPPPERDAAGDGPLLLEPARRSLDIGEVGLDVHDRQAIATKILVRDHVVAQDQLLGRRAAQLQQRLVQRVAAGGAGMGFLGEGADRPV